MENTLFDIQYDQYDDTSKAGVDYVRVTNGITTVTYDSTKLNSIAGIVTSAANFASAPGLTEPTHDWAKSTARLVSGSAAVDKGKAVGGIVPAKDIDGEARPKGAGVNIGHD